MTCFMHMLSYEGGKEGAEKIGKVSTIGCGLRGGGRKMRGVDNNAAAKTSLTGYQCKRQNTGYSMRKRGIPVCGAAKDEIQCERA